MSPIEEAVLAEFGAYYQGDALPPPGELDAALPLLARGSASRLRQRCTANVPELVRLLRELRDDPSHPLHGHIMNRTEIYWPDVPELWTGFQRLMDLIVVALDG